VTDGPERRQAKRIAIRLPVVYRGADGTTRHATTENVSRRGMLIVAQANAPHGTRLRVAVTGADGKEREVVGDVVRSAGDGRIAVSITEGGDALDELVDTSED
jgi:hypothetical protein